MCKICGRAATGLSKNGFCPECVSAFCVDASGQHDFQEVNGDKVCTQCNVSRTHYASRLITQHRRLYHSAQLIALGRSKAGVTPNPVTRSNPAVTLKPMIDDIAKAKRAIEQLGGLHQGLWDEYGSSLSKVGEEMAKAFKAEYRTVEAEKETVEDPKDLKIRELTTRLERITHDFQESAAQHALELADMRASERRQVVALKRQLQEERNLVEMTNELLHAAVRSSGDDNVVIDAKELAKSANKKVRIVAVENDAIILYSDD